MNWAEHELNHDAKYQDVILFLKNIGLLKDKSKQLKFHNKPGRINYE